eukprot:g841.t1
MAPTKEEKELRAHEKEQTEMEVVAAIQSLTLNKERCQDTRCAGKIPLNKWDSVRQTMFYRRVLKPGKKAETEDEALDLSVPPDRYQWKPIPLCELVNKNTGKKYDISPRVTAPRVLSGVTLRRHRKDTAEEIGMKLLEADGSAVTAADFTAIITTGARRVGINRCRRQIIEVQIRFDATGACKWTVTKRKVTNTYICVHGSHEHMHKPDAQYAAVHHFGGDGRENLEVYLCSIYTFVNEHVQKAFARNNPDDVWKDEETGWWHVICRIEIDFEAEGKHECRIRFLLGADLAGHDSLFGGTGFAPSHSTKPCIWCQCPGGKGNSQLHVANDPKTGKPWARKTYEWKCWASHWPDMRRPEKAFPFTCPCCKQVFKSMAEVDADEVAEPGSSKAKKWRKTHPGCAHKKHPLFMIEMVYMVICTLHAWFGGLRGQHDAGPGAHVTDKDVALEANKFNHHFCRMPLKRYEAGKSTAKQIIKLTSLSGAQAKAMVMLWDHLLYIVYGLTPDDIRSPTAANQNNVSEFKSSSRAMDLFRELWNECATRMDREEGESRCAPVSEEVKAEKVVILNGLSRAYRRALLVAYNARSFTMYQHSLCSHMGELQAHLQSDLCDYNQECIEHLGKQFTQVLHEGTNMLLLEGQMGCLAQAVAETHLRKRGRERRRGEQVRSDTISPTKAKPIDPATETSTEQSRRLRLEAEAVDLTAEDGGPAVGLHACTHVVKLEELPDGPLTPAKQALLVREWKELRRQGEQQAASSRADLYGTEA